MEENIHLLDTVLQKLSKEGFGSVPELIDGFQKYPLYNSELDKKYKIIEDELVRLDLVDKLGGGGNKTPNGYFRLGLSPVGRKLVSSNLSVAALYEKEKGKSEQSDLIQKLTLENLQYQQTIREQDQRIRDLTETDKRLSIFQKYWWFIGLVTSALGYLFGNQIC